MTTAERESAMQSIRTVMQALPVEFAISDVHPLDHLMHALGVLATDAASPASNWLQSSDGTETVRERRPSDDLDAWIEREFRGYGIAIRKRSDPPIPGEPFMSIAIAKDLTRRAVATFASPASGGEWRAIDVDVALLRAALAEIIELKPEDMYHASENSMAAAIARAALAASPSPSVEEIDRALKNANCTSPDGTVVHCPTRQVTDIVLAIIRGERR